MRALREDPRLIRYIVVVAIGMPLVLGLSALFPDRLDEQLLPFLVAFSVAFLLVYLLGVAIEAFFRRRWSKDR